MPKSRRFLLAAICLTLVACAGTVSAPSLDTLSSGADSASPEADPQAPGMIPAPCEQLLNKITEWKLNPGEERWRPASLELAREALHFFSDFYLVPESTSKYSRAWLVESPPKGEVEALASLERINRAQSCDLMLAHRLLLSLVNYSWPAAEKDFVRAQLLRFVLNQQALTMPSLARAVQINVLGKAAKRNLLRVNAGEVAKVQKWFASASAEAQEKLEKANSRLEQWRLYRLEWNLSEEARSRLSSMIPLP